MNGFLLFLPMAIGFIAWLVWVVGGLTSAALVIGGVFYLLFVGIRLGLMLIGGGVVLGFISHVVFVGLMLAAQAPAALLARRLERESADDAMPSRPPSSACGPTAETPSLDDTVQFAAGDLVVYPSHGIGRIQKIDEQEVAGRKVELFVIAFDKEKMILRVPTTKAIAVGMRKLTPAQIAEEKRLTLEQRPSGQEGVREPQVTIIRLSAPPLANDRTPFWTAELETAARDKVPPSSSGPKTFEARFPQDGKEVSGVAIAGEFQGKHRVWQLRAVVLPAPRKWVASLHFVYPGENRELPGGGQKMHPRRPIHDREVRELTNIQDAFECLLRVEQLDVIAEEAYREATAQTRVSMSKMIDALGSDDPNALKNWSDDWVGSMQSMANQLNQRDRDFRKTNAPVQKFAVKRVLEGPSGPMLEIEPPPLNSDGIPDLTEELALLIEPYIRDRDNIALRFVDKGLPTTTTAVISSIDIERPGVAVRYSIRIMLFAAGGSSEKTGCTIHARPMLLFLKGDRGERLGVQQKISEVCTYDFFEFYDDMEQASDDLERIVKIADERFKNRSRKS